jgi:AAA15 family ATPase/GTPase
MLLQLKMKNYRSYKNETVFSMEANSYAHKPDNVFEVGKDKKYSLLNNAIIYGANASGKSNVIRALFEIITFIKVKPKVNDRIRLYDPFLFDIEQKNLPCEFELLFLDINAIKYHYKFSILEYRVVSEELNYYPKGKITKVFAREPFNEKNIVQKGILGDSFKNKEINVFANQLILSKFGDDEPHELLSELFLYFKSYEVINATNTIHKDFYDKKVSADLYNNDNFKNKVEQLIKAADTKINSIDINYKEEEDHGFSTPKKTYQVYGIHDLYHNNKIIGEETLSFPNESTGTQTLYVLGGKIISILESGGVLAIDELDTSLHPFITKMIVMIFQNKNLNPKNAQLIFTTHDVTLLDRDLIRRDQIWISEKDEKGVSDLYSLQDFEGLREDTPFDKWYLAGKFGGLPKIESIESIFTSHD